MTPPGLESQSFCGTGNPRCSWVGSGERVLLVQAALVLLCSAAVWGLADRVAVLASLLGGSAAVAGSLAFAAVARMGRRPAPTPWQALRAVVMAESAKWAVSLGALAALLSGAAQLQAVIDRPGWAVLAFCVAWAAPLLALMTDKEMFPSVWPPKT